MGPGPKSSQSSVAKDGSKGNPPAEDSKRVGIFQSAVRSNLSQSFRPVKKIGLMTSVSDIDIAVTVVKWILK